jgi:hypothetical protein
MKVVLDKKEYLVKSLTIEQYELLQTNKELKDYELIHLLTGAPVDEIKSAPFSDVKFVSKMLMSDWAAQDDIEPLHQVVVFNEKKYGLIIPSKISYEEWINLEVFMAEKPLNLVKLATHLYKPITSNKYGDNRELISYSLDECASREHEFRKFPVKSVLSALFFLAVFGEKLMETILSSMENKTNEMKQEIEKKKKALLKK